jgi:hypothetical protein
MRRKFSSLIVWKRECVKFGKHCLACSAVALLHATVPLYSVSHQCIVQSNTIQQASAPLSEVVPCKVRVLFPDFIHCQAKLTQPYNELTRQTGCKLYDFFSPYTLLLLSWKPCKNREHYTALNVKVRHESLSNQEFSCTKKTRHFTVTSPTSCLTVIRSKIRMSSKPVIWIYREFKIRTRYIRGP